MFDINFFKKSYDLKKKIVQKKYTKDDFSFIEKELELIRDRKPFIFNVETTNYCNMTCVMCPRTVYMKRKNVWISDDVFEKAINSITTYSNSQINSFFNWLSKNTNYNPSEISENGFYFSVVSQCLILHGYGEPFLDKFLIKRIKLCTKKNIPTYFSCTPATMTVEKAIDAMRSGLRVLKFSLDAMDDDKIKSIRGRKANYNDSIKKIEEIIKIKKREKLETLLVPCMIAFDKKPESIKLHNEFLNFWKEKDVFAYIKSQDNRWLFEQQKEMKNDSHYAKQYCEYPWTSVTIMADGNVVPCTQISNNELVFGNINENTLEEIWNSKKYQEFRNMHVSGNFPKDHKCLKNCDQVKLFEYLN